MTEEEELLTRITVKAGILDGKPIVRDMRIAVEHVFSMLASGDTPERILNELPFLEPDDIRACLIYAHRTESGERFVDRGVVW